MELDPQHLGEVEPRRRSLLGAALSIEYGPCSVAAAELSRSACNRFKLQNESTLEEVARAEWEEVWARAQCALKQDGFSERQLIRHKNDAINARAEIPEKLIVTDSSVPIWRDCISHRITPDERSEVSIMLVQDVVETETQETETFSDKKRLRPDKKETVEYTKIIREPGDIWLADNISDTDILMPLVTFQPRTDGNCSYVQIGQEINDDTIFAVQTDEQTIRLQLIDDMRKLVTNDASPEERKRLKQFVYSERERNAEQLVVALGAWIAEYSSTMNSWRTGHNIVIEPDGTTIYQDEVLKAPLLPGPGYAINTGVSSTVLELIKPKTQNAEDAPIILGAVARGNVCFPIIEFFPDTGETRFVEDDKVESVNQYKSLLAVVSLLKRGAAYTEERAYGEFKQVTGSEKNPGKYILDMFSIEDKIAAHLSPECAKQENLARAIGAKALGVEYHGKVEKVYLENTDGSISGFLRLDRVNDAFQLGFAIKPDALDDVPAPSSPFYTLVYDPTEKLGDRLPSDLDADDFTRLVKGLNDIKRP